MGSILVFFAGTFHVLSLEVQAGLVRPALTAASILKNMAVMCAHEPPSLHVGNIISTKFRQMFNLVKPT